MNNLPVPYISQITPGALIHNNDCGAACALMVARTYNQAKDKTVDQIYDRIAPAGDIPLSASGLQAALGYYGVKSLWMAGVHIHDMYDVLADWKPIIALIHYDPLVKAELTEKKSFRGAHFVVVTGMDIKSICIHDPYTTESGENLDVPIVVFEQAWSQCNLDGNPDHAGIFMTLPIQDLTATIPVPVTNRYTFTVYNGVLVNGANVRSGPSQAYSFVKTIWRTETPFVYITRISGEYGQLADGTGWLFMGFFKKA